jgi:uncharacterized protein (TIGR02145 family)
MKTLKMALYLLGALLLTYCQESPLELSPSGSPDQELILKDHHVNDGCVFVQKLWAGAGQNDITKAVEVGSITAVVDYPYLHLTFSVHPHKLNEIHVWIGNDLKLIPKNAAPGQFPIKKKTGAAGTYQLMVDLSKMGVQQGELFYIAAHGVAMVPSSETFWAYGEHTFTELGVARKWGWVFEVDQSRCEEIADGDPCPGMPYFTDPRDGNVYKTVNIGGQCWFKENLRYLPRVEGYPYRQYSVYDYPVLDEDGFAEVDLDEAKATDNYKNYGVLYDWLIAPEVCPAGWHLPTIDEWNQMIGYVMNKHPEYTLPQILNSCRQVNSPLGGDCDTEVHPRWDQHDELYGLDLVGFSALPGGMAGWFFNFRGNLAIFWTASEEFTPNYWNIRLRYDSPERYHGSSEFLLGFSVRCMKDKHNE